MMTLLMIISIITNIRDCHAILLSTMIMFLLVPLVACDRQEFRSSTAQARYEMMEVISPAIYSYHKEHMALPPHAEGFGSVNGSLGQDAPAFLVPSFRIWRSDNEVGEFALLTTPVAYLRAIPKDQNAAGDNSGAAYAYYSSGNKGVVFSCGVDNSYETDPGLLFLGGQLNEDYMNTIRYDPTNGIDSKGDILVFVIADK